ncbi:MAG: hypothetical protein QXY18_03220 [Nitrososphaerota archaeon]
MRIETYRTTEKGIKIEKLQEVIIKRLKFRHKNTTMINSSLDIDYDYYPLQEEYMKYCDVTPKGSDRIKEKIKLQKILLMNLFQLLNI